MTGWLFSEAPLCFICRLRSHSLVFTVNNDYDESSAVVDGAEPQFDHFRVMLH